MASGKPSTARLRELLRAEAGHSVRRAFCRPVVATTDDHNAAAEAIETLAGEAEVVWDEATEQSQQQAPSSSASSSTWPAILEARLCHLGDLTGQLCSDEASLCRARELCSKEHTHLRGLSQRQQQQQQQQTSENAHMADPGGNCLICGRRHANDRQGDELGAIYAQDLEYVAGQHASLHEESETEALRLLLATESSKLQGQLMVAEQSADARRRERQAEVATMRRLLIEAGCKVSNKDFDDELYSTRGGKTSTRAAKLKLNVAQLQHRTSSLKAAPRRPCPGGHQASRQRTAAMELDTGCTLRKAGARVACPKCLILEPPRPDDAPTLSKEESASSLALDHWLQTAGDKVVSAKRYSSVPVVRHRNIQDPNNLIVLNSSHHVVPETKDQGSRRYWLVSNYVE